MRRIADPAVLASQRARYALVDPEPPVEQLGTRLFITAANGHWGVAYRAETRSRGSEHLRRIAVSCYGCRSRGMLRRLSAQEPLAFWIAERRLIVHAVVEVVDLDQASSLA